MIYYHEHIVDWLSFASICHLLNLIHSGVVIITLPLWCTMCIVIFSATMYSILRSYYKNNWLYMLNIDFCNYVHWSFIWTLENVIFNYISLLWCLISNHTYSKLYINWHFGLFDTYFSLWNTTYNAPTKNKLVLYWSPHFFFPSLWQTVLTDPQLPPKILNGS